MNRGVAELEPGVVHRRLGGGEPGIGAAERRTGGGTWLPAAAACRRATSRLAAAASRVDWAASSCCAEITFVAASVL